MEMLGRFVKWLKELRGHNQPSPQFFCVVLKTFAQRDFSTLAICRTNNQRAVSVFRAVPRYPSARVEIWIWCEHLSTIPGQPPVKREPGCDHVISVMIPPIGNNPSIKHCVFTQQLCLRDFLTDRSCAAVFTQMFATKLIFERYDMIDWAAHCAECQSKALAQISTPIPKRVYRSINTNY